MLVALLVRGPFDGRRLILPISEPWERFVVPERWDPVLVQTLYLFAGRLDEDYAYLYEDDWGELLH